MKRLVSTLRDRGHGKAYDAVVGLSGGIDSAYLAHLASRLQGLRLLAIHVDGGWNTEPAVHNIESMVRGLRIDLYTYVVEWQEMRDLQTAFLRASVLNQDIPQDHAFFAVLYRSAAKFGIQHFLSGVNFASESVIPPDWGFPSMDGTHVREIHRRFGQIALETFPIISLGEYLWMTRVRGRPAVHKPLNYLNYDREQAKVELRSEYGWRDYGVKHGESRFTKFYQEIYLPRRYGFDKRRLHLSSLIVSGQLTREQALAELESPVIGPGEARRDLRFIAKKLGLSEHELERLIDAPAVNHTSYPSQINFHRMLSTTRRAVRWASPRRRFSAFDERHIDEELP